MVAVTNINFSYYTHTFWTNCNIVITINPSLHFKKMVEFLRLERTNCDILYLLGVGSWDLTGFLSKKPSTALHVSGSLEPP